MKWTKMLKVEKSMVAYRAKYSIWTLKFTGLWTLFLSRESGTTEPTFVNGEFDWGWFS